MLLFFHFFNEHCQCIDEKTKRAIASQCYYSMCILAKQKYKKASNLPITGSQSTLEKTVPHRQEKSTKTVVTPIKFVILSIQTLQKISSDELLLRWGKNAKKVLQFIGCFNKVRG